MSDTNTYIQYGITGLSLITSMVLAYMKVKEKKLENDSVCEKDFQALQTKVSVLEERLSNEIHLLDKLSDKLDDIRDKL